MAADTLHLLVDVMSGNDTAEDNDTMGDFFVTCYVKYQPSEAKPFCMDVSSSMPTKRALTRH